MRPKRGRWWCYKSSRVNIHYSICPNRCLTENRNGSLTLQMHPFWSAQDFPGRSGRNSVGLSNPMRFVCFPVSPNHHLQSQERWPMYLDYQEILFFMKILKDNNLTAHNALQMLCTLRGWSWKTWKRAEYFEVSNTNGPICTGIEVRQVIAGFGHVRTVIQAIWLQDSLIQSGPVQPWLAHEEWDRSLVSQTLWLGCHKAARQENCGLHPHILCMCPIDIINGACEAASLIGCVI